LFDELDGHARGEIYNKAGSGDGGFAAWVKRQRAGAGKAKEKLLELKSIPVIGDPPDISGSIDPVLQDKTWSYAFRQWAEENQCSKEVMFLLAIDSFRRKSTWEEAQYIVDRYFFKDPDMFDNWTEITARINRRVQEASKRIQDAKKTGQ
jgi:hypothetical protein